MQKFLDCLASPGGHLLMLILLVLALGYMSVHGIPKAADMMEDAFGAFIALMVPGAAKAVSNAIA